MKKSLVLIALVALIVFCSFFAKIKTAAAPIENNASISQIVELLSTPIIDDLETVKEDELTLSRRIVAVIELIETQGHPDCGSIAGGSGEKGCLQFQAPTWRSFSKEFYGEVLTQTPDREREVANFKVQQWLDKGYSPRQIFLTWNQGNPSPCKRGINKFGVRFDSCTYADRGVALLGS